MKLLTGILLSVVVALVLVATATAACDQVSLPAIEMTVMCPVCGTPLATANGPQAERERAFIRRRIANCESESQIKAALVAEYGSAVLAVPRKSGFELAAWVVPAVLALIGAGAILLGATRWRHAQRIPSGPVASTNGAGVRPADAKRLEDELDQYDL